MLSQCHLGGLSQSTAKGSWSGGDTNRRTKLIYCFGICCYCKLHVYTCVVVYLLCIRCKAPINKVTVIGNSSEGCLLYGTICSVLQFQSIFKEFVKRGTGPLSRSPNVASTLGV